MYGWYIAHNLASLGHEVVILTNNIPLFDRDFVDFPGRKNIRIFNDNFYGTKNNEAINIVKNCDFITTVPVESVDYAVTYGKMCGKKVIAFIFEPLNLLMEAIEYGIPIRFNENELAWQDYQKQIRKVDCIICNNEFTAQKTKEWIQGVRVEHLYNGINTHIADKIEQVPINERENSVVFCSRTEDYKGFGYIPYVFCSTKIKPKIYYISGFIDRMNVTHMKFFQFCKEQNLDMDVKKLITEKEKFEIIARSKALFFPSKFEGFGLPIAEAFYFKTPVVCFDLPVIKNVYKEFPHYIPFDDGDFMISLFDRIMADERELFRGIDEAQAYVKSFCTIENYQQNLTQIVDKFLGKKIEVKKMDFPVKVMPKIEQGQKEVQKTQVIVFGYKNDRLLKSLNEQSFTEFDTTFCNSLAEYKPRDNNRK